MENKIRGVILPLLAAAAIMFAAGCADEAEKGDYGSLQSQYSELQEQYDDLKIKYNALQGLYNTLSDESEKNKEYMQTLQEDLILIGNALGQSDPAALERAKSEMHGVYAFTYIPPSQTPTQQPAAAAAESNAVEAEYNYIGNKNSHKFHLPDCSTLPNPENRVYFETRDEAVGNGYTPCKRCNP